MQCSSSLLLLALVFAGDYAQGLTIVQQERPMQPITLSPASAQSPVLKFIQKPPKELPGDSQVSDTQIKPNQTSDDGALPDADAADIDDVLLRPNAGKGPDTVKFALRVKNFYGTDLNSHTWRLDMVMTVKWNDPRVVALIPAGLDKLSMAWSQALKLIWMPGVVVSNRDIEKYEILAASVTIFRSGDVRRVERANARLMKKYVLSDYPFDTQQLNVNIASSKYMSDEVVLVPDKTAAGVEENIWGLYHKQAWDTGSYVTHDGELEKSRGYLSVTVKRSLEKYSQDHLLPTFIVLIISWSVFYFPFANPFIMARLALSILALLTFTNLMVKSTKALPGAAEYNWNDLFNQQIQALMFITIVGNVSSEILMHQFFEEHLARHVNHAAKVIVPGLSIISISTILSAAHWKYMTLQHTSMVTQIGMNVVGFAYCCYFVHGLATHDKLDFTHDLVEQNKATKEKEEVADDGGADGGDM